jgi:pilus assembly protein Flp/PilA
MKTSKYSHYDASAVAAGKPRSGYCPLGSRVMKNILRKLRRDEDGAALVEYGLLVGLIAVIAVGAVTTLGTKVNGYFTSINGSL